MRGYLMRLREGMNVVADRHDMQMLADPDVAALSESQIGDVFKSLNSDWLEALEHAGHPDIDGRTACPVDGEALPCAVLRRISAKYAR